MLFNIQSMYRQRTGNYKTTEMKKKYNTTGLKTTNYCTKNFNIVQKEENYCNTSNIKETNTTLSE
jgi:phage terminase large subunit-like protein